MTKTCRCEPLGTEAFRGGMAETDFMSGGLQRKLLIRIKHVENNAHKFL